MKNTYSKELRLLWSSRVEAFKASSLTQAEFCKINDYKIRQFNYWLRKFIKPDVLPQSNDLKWMPVNVTEPMTNDSLVIKIGTAMVEKATSYSYPKKCYRPSCSVLFKFMGQTFRLLAGRQALY